MGRFERLLIPIIAAVMIAAFLLEGLGASSVRTIAIVLGVLLIVAMVFGMYHRARAKLRAAAAARQAGQTSNGPDGG